ncbi:MAG: hypothetical protein AB7G40_05475 [Hyphomonadaceae bacterium]
MMALLPRVLTLIALVFLIVTQVCLEVHFWMSFASPDQFGQRLVVMIGAGLAFLEVFMLALAHDAARRGFTILAWLWRTVFVAVLLVNLPATFGAVTAVTGADHGLRRQSATVYRQHETAIARIDVDIRRLEASFDDPELNRPNAALAQLLDERLRRRAALEAEGTDVPQQLATRIARLQSALATAEMLERLAAERDRSLRYLAEHAPPAADHPQTSGIITVLASVGIEASGEQVRAGLAFTMVAVLKVVLNLGFLIATATRDPVSRTATFPWLKAPAAVLQHIRRNKALSDDLQEPTPPSELQPPLPPEPAAPPPRKRRQTPRKRRFDEDLEDDLDALG